MSALDKLCEAAHAAGMSYGKYISTLSQAEQQAFKQPEKREGVKCIKCGEWFAPGVTKSGLPSKKHTCPKCIEEKRRCEEEARANRRHRRTKEYHSNCTRCGKEVITRQPLRKSGNLYCEDCRREVQKLRRREERAKKGEVA